MMRRLLYRGISIVEDAIERFGRSRDDLFGSLKHALSRLDEVCLENVRLQEQLDEIEAEKLSLEDEIGRLRFNGPTLYRDEVQAIEGAIMELMVRAGSGDTCRPELDRTKLQSLRNLLERCDPIPLGSDRVDDMIARAMERAQRE